MARKNASQGMKISRWRVVQFFIALLLLVCLRYFSYLLFAFEPSATATPPDIATFFDNNSIPLLIWTAPSPRAKSIRNLEGYVVDNCGDDQPSCIFTHEREVLPYAAAVLFSSSKIKSSDIPPKTESQPWVFWSVDSPYRTSTDMSDPALVDMFDRTMTYRFDSDYPIPFLNAETLEAALQPLDPPLSSRSNDVPIVWHDNSCQSFNSKESFVQELSNFVQIDSVGKCLHNKEPKNQDAQPADALQDYKFALVLEEANCRDYVTSGIHEAFAAGAIPIISAAKDMRRFLPSAKSAIIIEDFYSIQELAQYINYLNENNTALLEYHSYRKGDTSGLSGLFVETWQKEGGQSVKRGFCSLCQEASQWASGISLKDSKVTTKRVAKQSPLFDVIAIDSQCQPPHSLTTFVAYGNYTTRWFAYSPSGTLLMVLAALCFIAIALFGVNKGILYQNQSMTRPSRRKPV